MKKLIYLFALTIGAAGCSVDSLDSEQLVVANAHHKSMGQEIASSDGTLTSYMFMSGKSGNEKAELTVSNTCDEITLTFTPKNDEEIEVKFDIFKTLPAVNVNPGNSKETLSTGTIKFTEVDLSNNSYSISFKDLDVDASDNVYIFARMGNEDAGTQILGDWEYFTYDITEETCCEESFTYFDNADGTYTFTYSVGEDMDDAKLVFTFAQGAYVSGLSDDFIQNGNNGQTYKAVMDLEKCDVLEYTVTLTPNCSGNSNESNVWTDFKINEDSKKANEEDKFTASCN